MTPSNIAKDSVSSDQSKGERVLDLSQFETRGKSLRLLFLVLLISQMIGIANILPSLDFRGEPESFDGRPMTQEEDHPPMFCEDNIIQTYAVCNGFSNQVLGHAAFITEMIQKGVPVHIPDAFIIQGVQVEPDGHGSLKNVFAKNTNSVPLTAVIDGESLLTAIRSHGVDACFIPHNNVISRPNESLGCGWLAALSESSDEIELDILTSLKPSEDLDEVVSSTFARLQEKIGANVDMGDGICLHHRDGPDWHKHCTIWQGNNCLNFEEQPIEDLMKNRIPKEYPKKWLYYVGDSPPSASLSEMMKEKTGLKVLHRAKDALLDEKLLQKKFLDDHEEPKVEIHRDIFAAVDFFVCKRVESFTGNSVSTFSALQIATRGGKNTTWYNSRSNPLLAEFLKVQTIPVVYTYTEDSAVMGRYLLKASISSVRQAFGFSVDINIIYHGTKDKEFLKWLTDRKVIVHNHDPNWFSIIDTMIENADHSRSHLYAHRGNYIGTWQRIDIPLFIKEEYVILLDADTIVHKKFDLSHFGLEITPGIAIAQESELDPSPANLGVAVFNVPKMRETYHEFVDFIRDNAYKNVDFVLGPSDQGAYLDFYHSHKNPGVELNYEASHYVRRLWTVFNIKPYYKQEKRFHNRFILHFHGLKPHEILKSLMGYRKDELPGAVEFLYDMMFPGGRHELVCLALHDFAVALADDEKNMRDFCDYTFDDPKESLVCTEFFTILATMPENGECIDILTTRGYAKFVPCSAAEAEYLESTPEAGDKNLFATAYDHYIQQGRYAGKKYPDCPRGQAFPGTIP